jgi:hypothetical protein
LAGCSCIYNRYAIPLASKTPSKTGYSYLPMPKSVNSRGHRLSTTNDTRLDFSLQAAADSL